MYKKLSQIICRGGLKMGTVAEFIKAITEAMALYGFGSASSFGAHQPKEPEQTK